jgi:hypothetical protein
MAGSSKRSVKEAYTRAKQWLRRRSRLSKSSRADSDAEGDSEVPIAGPGNADSGADIDVE